MTLWQYIPRPSGLSIAWRTGATCCLLSHIRISPRKVFCDTTHCSTDWNGFGQTDPRSTLPILCWESLLAILQRKVRIMTEGLDDYIQLISFLECMPLF